MGDYRAPLFLAWQLTNGCAARCLHCCEGSGPDKRWRDELSQGEAIGLAAQIVRAGIPYCAFGGGEPLGVPHVWEVFRVLSEGGVAVKIETDGTLIDEAAADRLASLAVHSVQVSIDGATAATHERVRPGGDFLRALAGLERVIARGLPGEFVFVPTRLNLHEARAAYDLAAFVGARVFVTGPMMRLGRAAAGWAELAPSEADWRRTAQRLEAAAVSRSGGPKLSVYPWDIVTEIETRLREPQAMLLVVPDGKVKLLNALPFACADLRSQSIAEAWPAYQAAWARPEVREFCLKVRADPSLLRHANETWGLGSMAPRGS